MQPHPELGLAILARAKEAESELKRLGRWQSQPLPPEQFANMGAFGSNTMTFEQWIQFVLIPRIRSIVETKDDFPSGSMLAPYAIRYFDGDPEGGGDLHRILSEIDDLINGGTVETEEDGLGPSDNNTIRFNDETIPSVMYTLAELLPQYEGDPLESQLQTFDTFLSVLAPGTRPAISRMLREAAAKTRNPESKMRIEQAADSIEKGGRAANPYNHEEAMKNYISNFRKSYPDNYTEQS